MQFSTLDVLLLCLFLLLGIAVVFISVTAYTAWVLTHPYRRTYASAVARGRAGDPAELRRADGSSYAYTSWELNGKGFRCPVWDVVGGDPQGPVFILSHGWGDSRIGGLTRLTRIGPLASRVILWDMPGHGEADGICRLGTLEPLILGELMALVGTPAILYGWSLGAGVSIVASLLNGGRGIIAEAPYRRPETPAENVLRSWGLPHGPTLRAALGLLGMCFGVGWHWAAFDREVRAAAVSVPLLVIHGEADEVCPVDDGGRIAASCAYGDIEVIPGAGHHGLWTDDASASRCEDAVRRFLERLRAEEALNSRHAHGHAEQSHS